MNGKSKMPKDILWAFFLILNLKGLSEWIKFEKQQKTINNYKTCKDKLVRQTNKNEN